jgi:hypothetical protein
MRLIVASTWLAIFSVLCAVVVAQEQQPPVIGVADAKAADKAKADAADANAGKADTKTNVAPANPEVGGVEESVWLANHSIRLRRDGNLPGQLRTYEPSGELIPVRAKVSFLHRNEIASKASTREYGYFQAVGLHEGPYGVVAVGRDGFGALSIKISTASPAIAPPSRVKTIAVSDREGLPGGGLPLTEEERWEHLILSATVIPEVDLVKVGQIIAYRIPEFREPNAVPVNERERNQRLEPLPKPKPPSKQPGTPTGYGRLGILLKGNAPTNPIVEVAMIGAAGRRGGYAISELPSGMLPYDGPWFAGYTVAMGAKGTVSGVVHRFDAEGNIVPTMANVHFIQDGRLEGITLSDHEGRFTIDGVTVGNHSVVIAGPNALGAFSIRVLPPEFSGGGAALPEGNVGSDPKVQAKSTALRTMQNQSMIVSVLGPESFLTAFNEARTNDNLRQGFAQPGLDGGGAVGGLAGGALGSSAAAAAAGGGAAGGSGALGAIGAAAGLLAGLAGSQHTNTTSTSTSGNSSQ